LRSTEIRQLEGIDAPAEREPKCDLGLKLAPAPNVLVAGTGVDTGTLLHLGKTRERGRGGGESAEEGRKGKKGYFF
jgi:hypothetical protein